MPTPSEDNRWHLDKKVPIALICAMVVQFSAAMYFIAGVKAQGDANTRRIATLESQKVAERLASLEAQVAATNALLLRVDATMQRLMERPRSSPLTPGERRDPRQSLPDFHPRSVPSSSLSEPTLPPLQVHTSCVASSQPEWAALGA